MATSGVTPDGDAIVSEVHIAAAPTSFFSPCEILSKCRNGGDRAACIVVRSFMPIYG